MDYYIRIGAFKKKKIDGPKTFPGFMWGPAQNLGSIG